MIDLPRRAVTMRLLVDELVALWGPVAVAGNGSASGGSGGGTSVHDIQHQQQQLYEQQQLAAAAQRAQRLQNVASTDITLMDELNGIAGELMIFVNFISISKL